MVVSLLRNTDLLSSFLTKTRLLNFGMVHIRLFLNSLHASFSKFFRESSTGVILVEFCILPLHFLFIIDNSSFQLLIFFHKFFIGLPIVLRNVSAHAVTLKNYLVCLRIPFILRNSQNCCQQNLFHDLFYLIWVYPSLKAGGFYFQKLPFLHFYSLIDVFNRTN